MIVFVSDHGEQLWERNGFGHGQDMLHDELVRVPLIVKPPSGMDELARDTQKIIDLNYNRDS